MKEGLAIYLLYLFNGKPMHSEIKKMLNITKNAFGSDYDDESFYTIFLLWKSTTQMSDSGKKKIIKFNMETKAAVAFAKHIVYEGARNPA